MDGKWLDAKKVAEATRLELEFCEKMQLGDLVPEGEAMRVTGEGPVTAKWIDHDKGGGDYRSRYVARQFRGDAEAIYAATPPLEALKIMLSLAVSGRRRREGCWKLGFLDVSRAYFHAQCKSPLM